MDGVQASTDYGGYGLLMIPVLHRQAKPEKAGRPSGVQGHNQTSSLFADIEIFHSSFSPFKTF